MEATIEEKNRAIEEGLMPELKDDVRVQIGGRELILNEMPIFYVRQLNKKIAPIYGLLSGNISQESLVKSLIDEKSIDVMYKTLSEVGHFVANRYDENITFEWIEKHASEKEVLNLIQKQLEVNGIVDFLKNVLRAIVEMIARTPLETGLESM